METASQVEILESQLRELYGRVVWSHKTQEKCADIVLARHRKLKLGQIALAALTTTGILVTVFGQVPWVGVASAILSSILFGINTYSKDYDLGEIAQKHSTAASDLWNIRESYLSLLTDLSTGRVKLEEAMQRRNELQADLYNAYKGAPRTISKAYKQATAGLQKNEELTFSDKEVDKLLPPNLRKLSRP
jgi:hypothetical protein